MEDEKFLGEPSNSNNNRSLQNNNSSTNSSNSTNSSGQRPSSSTNAKQSSIGADDSSNYDGGDDVGWWDCSLCTYRNSSDKFKCEICDLRRGTSTRKPRCNADTIVAQVVKQQEQIRQQTRATKTPKSRSSTSSGLNAATSSNDSTSKSKSRPKVLETKNRRAKQENDDTDEEESATESVASPKPKKRRTNEAVSSQRRDERVAKRHGDNDEDSGESDSTDVTDDLSHTSSPRIHRSASESSLDTSHYSSSSSATSPEPAISLPVTSAKNLENPFKITPLAVSGNLIKYSPPTSSGRTGLIIDKKRFTQHSVTVNDVTITFTEFATRQNKYIRKKKKRRDASRSKSNNGNVKSRSKNESKSSSNNASSTASAGDR